MLTLLLRGRGVCMQAVFAVCAFSLAVGLKDRHTQCLKSVSTSFGKSKMEQGAASRDSVFNLFTIKVLLPHPNTTASRQCNNLRAILLFFLFAPPVEPTGVL